MAIPIDSSESSIKEKYKFFDVIGYGAFGTVYRAIDKENGKIVAIKKIDATCLAWEFVYNTEVKSLIKFHGHPNIVTLHEAMKDDRDDTLYLVFEYMPFDLYNFISNSYEKGIFFGEKHIKKWCFQLLRGLAYVHKCGWFHRDLKPSNLLVSTTGEQLKIADFGSVRSIHDKTPCKDKLWTRCYQPPEVLLGSTNYGPEVDMWAVGAIIAELFIGSPLFPGGSTIADQLDAICNAIGSPTTDVDKVIFADLVGEYEFPDHMKSADFKLLMPSASEDAISLIKLLCSWDPSKRPSVVDALRHPFFFGCYPVSKSYSSSDKLAAAVRKEEEKPIIRPPPGFQKKSLRPTHPHCVPSLPKIAQPQPPALQIPQATPVLLPHMLFGHNRS